MASDNHPRYTICVVRADDTVLLGFKKKKFGQGYWNGFGGKVESSESIEAAARREVTEECGLQLADCIHCGVITYTYDHDPAKREVHFFVGRGYSGAVQETAEMRPQWFPLNTIPYESMWPDSRYWLPLLLRTEQFEGRAHYRTYQDLADCQINRIAAPA